MFLNGSNHVLLNVAISHSSATSYLELNSKKKKKNTQKPENPQKKSRNSKKPKKSAKIAFPPTEPKIKGGGVKKLLMWGGEVPCLVNRGGGGQL